jgi:nucleotide-binding universal stress UspA family protein
VKILICYDGSDDARAAIQVTAELYGSAPAEAEAEVLTIWDGLAEVMVRAGSGLGAAPLDFEAIDKECEQAARMRSEEGVAHARNAGLNAHACVARRNGSIWETILDQADRIQADVLVLGSRGLTGLKSLLLGSVSHAVLQHSDRPVIVVPAQQIAERRRQRLRGRVAARGDPQ